MEVDETGRVFIPPPRRVGDVVGRMRHEADTERAVAGMVAGFYDEVRVDCPRCGEDVFVSKGAELGSSWRCESCGAHGQVTET